MGGGGSIDLLLILDHPLFFLRLPLSRPSFFFDILRIGFRFSQIDRTGSRSVTALLEGVESRLGRRTVWHVEETMLADHR